jgi:hypothetical protein
LFSKEVEEADEELEEVCATGEAGHCVLCGGDFDSCRAEGVLWGGDEGESRVRTITRYSRDRNVNEVGGRFDVFRLMCPWFWFSTIG